MGSTRQSRESPNREEALLYTARGGHAGNITVGDPSSQLGGTGSVKHYGGNEDFSPERLKPEVVGHGETSTLMVEGAIADGDFSSFHAIPAGAEPDHQRTETIGREGATSTAEALTSTKPERPSAKLEPYLHGAHPNYNTSQAAFEGTNGPSASGKRGEDSGGGRFLPPRWPTPRSVVTCSSYKWYALEAGDDVKNNHREPRCRKKERGRSQQPQGKTGVIFETSKCEAGESSSPEKAFALQQNEAGTTGLSTHPRSRRTTAARNRSCHSPPVAACKGAGGGLPALERDFKGAMVAVWLAWGVRIDAARALHGREIRCLEVAHLAEVGKVWCSTCCSEAWTPHIVEDGYSLTRWARVEASLL